MKIYLLNLEIVSKKGKMPRFTRAFLFYACLFRRSEKATNERMSRTNPERTEGSPLSSPVFGKVLPDCFFPFSE